jgi:predicted ferric reductase
VQEAIAINSGIIAFIGMVSLLVLTFFVKLPYRIWLFTHKFLGIAFVFAGVHILMVSSDIYNDAFLKTYFIAWTLIGFGAFLWRTVFGAMFVRKSAYKVVSTGTMPVNVVHIVLEPIDKKIDFSPGQFVFVKFLWSEKDGIVQEVHPFSIASSPNEQNQQLRLFIKALGDFTTSLKHLQVGTIVEIEGAFGKFVPTRYAETPQIWIAGGIGVTPFLSAARSFNKNYPPVDMFYTVQTKSELIDQDALSEFLPKYYEQFRYFPYVNELEKGFLSGKYVQDKSGGLTNKEIFICGPPPMMKSLRAQLRQLGVPNKNIHTEEFSMS